MAIRIREIEGKAVALCAAKSVGKEGDLYLDDNIHHALTTKFSADFYSEGFMGSGFSDCELLKIMNQEYKNQ